jgi:ribosome-associated protein
MAHARPVDGVAVNSRVTIPDDELMWRFSRSSGPGGQHVNTTDSQAELRWNLATTSALSDFLRERARERLANRLVDDSVVITASEYRSQHRNREAAKERLGALVREAIAPPPPPRRPTRPTRAAKERRLSAKKRRGDLKQSRRTTDD